VCSFTSFAEIRRLILSRNLMAGFPTLRGYGRQPKAINPPRNGPEGVWIEEGEDAPIIDPENMHADSHQSGRQKTSSNNVRAYRTR